MILCGGRWNLCECREERGIDYRGMNTRWETVGGEALRNTSLDGNCVLLNMTTFVEIKFFP